MATDALILGSPVYFGNVTGRLKVFMDRTRWLHMRKNLLAGKLGAVVTHAGLRQGGQEITQVILERFLISHGLRLVEPRGPGRPIYNTGISGTLFDAVDQGRFRWKKSVLDDALTVEMCRALGRNLVDLGASIPGSGKAFSDSVIDKEPGDAFPGSVGLWPARMKSNQDTHS